MAEEHGARAVDGFEIDWKHLVHQAEERIEGGLDGVSPVYRGIPVQDLLQNLGIGHEALLVGDATLENPLSVALVGMHGAHEVHGNVGVDEDHPWLPPEYPPSISWSMVAMSAVG